MAVRPIVNCHRNSMRGTAIIVGCVLLSGCDTIGNALPPTVRVAINAPFPDDGQLHVQSRGRFVIRPETMSCRAPRQIEKSLAAGAPRFLGPGLGEASQKSAGVSGILGEIVDGKSCTDDGVNIIDHWQLLFNRAGKPYKLVLAVWQGDPAKGGAYWIGGVERSVDRLRPELNKPDLMGFEGGRISHEIDLNRRLNGSIARDMSELSVAFVASIRMGELK